MYLDQFYLLEPKLKGTDPNTGGGPLEGDGDGRAFMRARMFTPEKGALILAKARHDLQGVEVSELIQDTRYKMDPTDNNGKPRGFYFLLIGGKVVELGQLFGLINSPKMDVAGALSYVDSPDDHPAQLTWTPEHGSPTSIVFTDEDQAVLQNTLKLIP